MFHFHSFSNWKVRWEDRGWEKDRGITVVKTSLLPHQRMVNYKSINLKITVHTTNTLNITLTTKMKVHRCKIKNDAKMYWQRLRWLFSVLMKQYAWNMCMNQCCKSPTLYFMSSEHGFYFYAFLNKKCKCKSIRNELKSWCCVNQVMSCGGGWLGWWWGAFLHFLFKLFKFPP